MRRVFRSVVLAGLLVPAAAAHAGVRVSGVPAVQARVCGASAPVAQVPVGALVRLAVTGGARSVQVERCVDGRWSGILRQRTRAARATALRGGLSGEHGDYRLRAGRGRPALLRVGVGEIVDVPVEFHVKNVNRSLVPCLPDAGGQDVTVRGSLVGPRAALEAEHPAVTLYYHGLSYGEFFWRFAAVPGYDAGRLLAEQGHIGVAVDRLGYGASDRPAGGTICYGSQADIAAQIADQLRDGELGYDFGRVALAGHSAGAFIAQMAVYSFPDAFDAVAVMGYSDSYATPLVTATLLAASQDCLTSGEDYVYFGRTDDDFRAGHVYDMDPAVEAALLKLRTKDPCGDLMSIPPSFAVNQLGISLIDVPVLHLIGDHDAFFTPPLSTELQGPRYFSSDAVTSVVVPDTGHAVTLGRSAPAVRAALGDWLAKNGF